LKLEKEYNKRLLFRIMMIFFLCAFSTPIFLPTLYYKSYELLDQTLPFMLGTCANLSLED